MENLLRVNNISEQGLHHLLPSASAVFKSEGELVAAMSSNNLKEKSRNNALLFLGHQSVAPSSSPGSGKMPPFNFQMLSIAYTFLHSMKQWLLLN